MFLFCTVYEGGKLGDCDNLHIRMTTLKEQEKQKEICRFSLEHIDSSSASDEAMILARLTRQADSWHFVVGVPSCPRPHPATLVAATPALTCMPADHRLLDYGQDRGATHAAAGKVSRSVAFTSCNLALQRNIAMRAPWARWM